MSVLEVCVSARGLDRPFRAGGTGHGVSQGVALGWQRSPRLGLGGGSVMKHFDFSLRDEVSREIALVGLQLSDLTPLNREIGRDVAEVLRGHFTHRQTDGPRNRFGAPSLEFWKDMMKAVDDGEASREGVTVGISNPAINQKVFGGTIHAKGKLLAIPARTEAYGRNPRDFANLKAVFFGNTLALVQKEEGSTHRESNIGGKNDLGMVFYWLKESVTQAADADALPSDDKVWAAILEATQDYFDQAKEAGQLNWQGKQTTS